MSSKKSENKNSKFNKELLNYLGDKQSQEERYAFEKQLHNDDFDFEAMEGFDDFDIAEISDDKNELENLLAKKGGKKRKVIYYQLAGIAASGILIVFLANLFFSKDINQTKELLSDEIITEETKTEPEIDQAPKMPDEQITKIKEDAVELEAEQEENKTIEVLDLVEIRVEAADVEDSESETDIHDIERIVLEKKELSENQVSPVAINMEKEQELPKSRNSKSEIKQIPSADFMATGFNASDSDIIIRGKVVDMSTEEPLPGVNLVMEDAHLGTVTDMNGDFSIKIPAQHSDKSLKVNYIGFVSEDVDVDKDTSLVIGLTQDILALEEVVVVGYGREANKKSRTGSISVVEMDEGKSNTEEAAQPKIGFPEFRKYLKNNIVIPESLSEGGSEKVKIKVTVHRDGNIRRVDIISSPGEDFSKEAIRLLLEGPEWQAKKINGKPETSEVILRIKFKR